MRSPPRRGRSGRAASRRSRGWASASTSRGCAAPSRSTSDRRGPWSRPSRASSPGASTLSSGSSPSSGAIGIDADVMIEPGFGATGPATGSCGTGRARSMSTSPPRTRPAGRSPTTRVQLAWNLYLDNPGDDGDLHVWERRWAPEDDERTRSRASTTTGPRSSRGATHRRAGDRRRRRHRELVDLPRSRGRHRADGLRVVHQHLRRRPVPPVVVTTLTRVHGSDRDLLAAVGALRLEAWGPIVGPSAASSRFGVDQHDADAWHCVVFDAACSWRPDVSPSTAISTTCPNGRASAVRDRMRLPLGLASRLVVHPGHQRRGFAGRIIADRLGLAAGRG